MYNAGTGGCRDRYLTTDGGIGHTVDDYGLVCQAGRTRFCIGKFCRSRQWCGIMDIEGT